VSFAAAGFGAYDSNVKPYGSYSIISSNQSLASQSTGQATPQTSSATTPMMSGALPSPTSHSIHYGTAGLQASPVTEAKAVDANYGEGSGPNKRPHVEAELPPSQLGSQPQASQPYPGLVQGQQSFQQPYQFQAGTDGRQKAKGLKKVGKKVEPQPVAGMFNDQLGKYDSPVSIRAMLQSNKVDMTWMDLVAWSPAVAREIKRLCTRVAKKKMPKAKAPSHPKVNKILRASFPNSNHSEQAFHSLCHQDSSHLSKYQSRSKLCKLRPV